MSYTGNQFKKDVTNGSVAELGRDGLDKSSVSKLIGVLRQKYPEDAAIIKLSEMLGAVDPPLEKQERNGKKLVCMDHGVERKDDNEKFQEQIKANSGKSNKHRLHEITVAINAGDITLAYSLAHPFDENTGTDGKAASKKAGANIDKCASVNVSCYIIFVWKIEFRGSDRPLPLRKY